MGKGCRSPPTRSFPVMATWNIGACALGTGIRSTKSQKPRVPLPVSQSAIEGLLSHVCQCWCQREKETPVPLIHAVTAEEQPGGGVGWAGLPQRAGDSLVPGQGAISGSLHWAEDKTHHFWPLFSSWLETAKLFLYYYYYY